MILYGYRALSTFLDKVDVNRLKSSDWDLLLSLDDFNKLVSSFKDNIISMKLTSRDSYFIKTKQGNYDIHLIHYNNSNKFLYENQEQYLSSKIIKDAYGNIFKIPRLQTLYEFKKSHRMIKKGFNKTMKDYYLILDKLGEDVVESDFYKLRFKETLKRATLQTKHINLKQSKDDFFKTKNVTYIYDHDSIHESVKLTKEPMYKRILAPNEEVLCSKELWDKLSDLHKKYCVLEESYTIAIERSLSKGKSNEPKEAFLLALESVCTTLTKGWFREFAYSNYREIVEMYEDRFWIKFQNDLRDGLIKPFNGSISY